MKNIQSKLWCVVLSFIVSQCRLVNCFCNNPIVNDRPREIITTAASSSGKSDNKSINVGDLTFHHLGRSSSRSSRHSCSRLYEQRRRNRIRDEFIDDYYYDDNDDDDYYGYEDDKKNDESDSSYYDYYSKRRVDDNGSRKDRYWDDEDTDKDSRQSRSRRQQPPQDQEEGVEQGLQQQEGGEQRRGGVYKVYFDDPVLDPKETQLDWEVCNSDGDDEFYDGGEKLESLVLLPPAVVDKPTAVLHFVGGTFFGSAPKLWYRNLLEGLVRNTQCAIIVTPIPVTIFKSPLKHVEISLRLQKSLEYAWHVVLEDEYGYETLQDVPLCGIGHSLGARLLTVLTTLTQNQPIHEQRFGGMNDGRRRGRRQRSTSSVPPYKSFVLISFTNYGASAGIPGVNALLRESKKNERSKQVSNDRQRKSAARKAQTDWWVDDDYYDDDADADFNELIEDLQGLFQTQASRFKTALTPKSEDLEFHPSPDQLWKAIKDDKRYTIPQTLLVQFDNDPVDQSSKLGRAILNSTDLKFARLRGNHLSPISVQDNDDNNLYGKRGGNGWFDDLPSKASKTIWMVLRGQGKSKAQEEIWRDLRQSIARYITEVVTK